MQHDSYSARERKMGAFLQRNAARLSGREERLAKAQAKRARKNAKRARDAELQRLADAAARDALDHGATRGLWRAGVHAEIV